MEIILHNSKMRLQVLGLVSALSHLVFYMLWTLLVPQAYESLGVRLFLGLLGLVLFVMATRYASASMEVRTIYSLLFFLQLPLFMCWMYWMNHGSAMWMATAAVMVVVYHHLTDWRIATVGTLVGLLGSMLIAGWMNQNMGHALSAMPAEHWMVFLFAWFSALVMAMSSANLRKERVQQSLAVLGIMAHEIRTPLATLSLIAQALRSEAQDISSSSPQNFENLAARIDHLTLGINHHVDLQLTNARYGHPRAGIETLSAKHLIERVLDTYPFGSMKERHCIDAQFIENFEFKGSEIQWTHVLGNLIKNALHSLKAAQSRLEKGDLTLRIEVHEQQGRISVIDRGMGIRPSHRKRVFEPFFSTNSETGHGLGLAFCKQVVEISGGAIFVHSTPGSGATFVLQLPRYQVHLPPEKMSSTL